MVLKLVSDLTKDHQIIVHLLWALQGMASRVDKGLLVQQTDMDRVCRLLRSFVEILHEAKKVDVLLPCLLADPVIGKRHRPSLLALLESHQCSRLSIETVSRLVFAGQRLLVQVRAHRQVAAKAMRDYAIRLEQLIEREEKELLPLLNRLPPAKVRWSASAISLLCDNAIATRQHGADDPFPDTQDALLWEAIQLFGKYSETYKCKE